MRRFLIIFMGLFILIGGVFCLFAPQTTYMQTGYVIGVLMLFHAVGNIVAWFDAKKYDEISGWYLVGAIISFIFAILILSTPLMQGAINVVILYMVIAWFIVMGSMGIVFAFKLKELKNKLPDVFKGSRWIVVLIASILLVIFAVICMFNPATMSGMLGTFIALSFIFTGANLITVGSYVY